jgi:predicted N-acyltransferase
MKQSKIVDKTFEIEVQKFNGKTTFVPKSGSYLCKSMGFETQDEAIMAATIAEQCEANGLSANDFAHLYPAIVRIIKQKSIWAN